MGRFDKVGVPFLETDLPQERERSGPRGKETPVHGVFVLSIRLLKKKTE